MSVSNKQIAKLVEDYQWDSANAEEESLIIADKIIALFKAKPLTSTTPLEKE